MLNHLRPSPLLDYTSEQQHGHEDAPAPLFSPLCLPPPLPFSAMSSIQAHAGHQTPWSTPTAAMSQTSAPDVEFGAAGGRPGDEEDAQVRQRREEGELRFREAQEVAAARRRVVEADKENQRRPSPSPSPSPSKVRRAGAEGGVRRMRSAAWEAQERLSNEARWGGRVQGRRGWYALLKEGAEAYAEGEVVWVCGGEDEMSVAGLERLKADSARGNDAAVYLLWKRLTSEAWYQKVGITDAHVAQQLLQEHGIDPRSVDRAIELEDDLATKQRVADLLLSMGGYEAA